MKEEEEEEEEEKREVVEENEQTEEEKERGLEREGGKDDGHLYCLVERLFGRAAEGVEDSEEEKPISSCHGEDGSLGVFT